jgi:vitamin B12 transporter
MMSKFLRPQLFYHFALMACAAGAAVRGQTAPEQLSGVQVYSERVANQAPAGTFAMPVSALKYEPLVDLQTRNLGEAQSDITIRGGTFESVGIKLGGLSLSDPQTGHYLAEIPVAPGMLTSPQIITGSELALAANNATSGAVAYGWRPIATRGNLALSVGQGQFASASVYQGFAGAARRGATQLRADVAWAHSASDGLIPYSDHDFDRANIRFQLIGARAQTDFFVGYQAKAFGWLNLYTPFNSPESENLQTLLIALNHRVQFSAGDFLEASAFYRRNKDDYAYNRFAPLGAVHPFQHTTWLSGAALSGRKSAGDVALEFRGEASTDELESTSLTFGRYHTRNMVKLALAAERSWAMGDRSRIQAKLGGTVDRSNRARTAWSPVAELAREWTGQGLTRAYVSFSGASQLPSYTALNSNPSAGLFRGNANLGREKARDFEIGFAGAFGGWSGQAVAFYRQDHNLVDWTYRRGVTARAANAVDVSTTGFELVARRSWAHADVVLGYTALTKDATYKTATVDASFYALNYAKHRLTAALIYRFNREWELRLDNTARLQADNPLRVIGGNETLSSALGLIFKPRALRGVSLSLRADNLWSSNYQEVPAVPASPRQISVGLAYAW